VTPEATLDLAEQIARIERELADTDRKRQEVGLAPWTLLAAGMTAGAALFAAGAAWQHLQPQHFQPQPIVIQLPAAPVR
jgi:hypothetical protein